MYYFIVFRPSYPFTLDELPRFIRPIKRASHPYKIAVELHLKNSLGEDDPHLHVVLATDNIERFFKRWAYFLGDHWACRYRNICRSPLGAMLYAANKEGAEPVFYRGNLVEPC